MALTIGPLVGWLVSVINRRFRRYSRRIQDSMGDVTRVSKESFEAPRLIKVYNAQEHLDRQFDVVNEHNLRSNMRLVLTKESREPDRAARDRTGRRRRALHRHRGRHRRPHDDGRPARLSSRRSSTSRSRCGSLVGVSGPLQHGIAAGQSMFEMLDEPAESQGGGYMTPPGAGRSRIRECLLHLRER